LSAVIQVCPSCGQLAQHLQLNEDQGARLKGEMLGNTKAAARWRFRPLLCQHCFTPHLAVWPRADERAKVLDSLSAPADEPASGKKGEKE
jgi:hypothetical protein